MITFTFEIFNFNVLEVLSQIAAIYVAINVYRKEA